MLVCLLFLVRVAFTLPSPEEATSTPSPFSSHDQSFEDFCSLKGDEEISYLKPWREIPQRAQGCSVPFHGPQGHGQHPEEVHIVHITDVSRMIQTLSSQHQALIAVTVWLDVASCDSMTNETDSQTSLNFRSKSMGNSSLPVVDAESSVTKRKKFPEILKLKAFAPDNPTEPFASQSKRETSRYYSTSNTAAQPVNNKKRPLVLLLTSDQSVQWLIKPGVCWSQETASKVQVVVEKDSLVDSDLAVEIVQKTWVKRINRKNIQRYARRTFHGIASFSQIREANSVRILIGPGSPRDQEISYQLSFRSRNKLNFCDFSSRENSHLVSASLTLPVSSEACVFGKESMMKLFVVEVETVADLSLTLMRDSEKATHNRSGKGSPGSLLSVDVWLAENKVLNETDLKGTSFTERTLNNVTVVLVSTQPIKWVLSSSVQQSYVHVVTGENDSIDIISKSKNALKLSSIRLPHTRTEFLHNVLTEFGSRVHYFLINYASGFTLSVDKPTHQFEAVSKFHQQSSSASLRLSPQQQTFQSPLTLSDNEKMNRVLSILESDMVVACRKYLFEIMLPASILTELGVKAIHLKDKSCSSHFNGTHFILSSQLQSCGSEVHTSGKDSVISNQVYVDFKSDVDHIHSGSFGLLQEDIRDLNMKQTGVPIGCSLNNKPNMDDYAVRSIFNSRTEMTPNENEDGGSSSPGPESSSSIYQLDLFQGNVLTGSLKPIKYSKSVIDVNERIYVRAWMDDAPAAQAVAESCWVNNLTNSASSGKNFKAVLLRGMCPVEESVKLEHQSSPFFPTQDKSFIFSFQILKDFMRLGQELYIHCQIGVCISSLKRFKGKPVLCVDPMDYCLHHKSLAPSADAVSTAHQLLTRGPILLSSLPTSDFEDNSLHMESKCTDVSSFPYSLAISVNMSIAIAVCSFIIGVALTAALWLIHHKTDPSRHARRRREYSLGSRSAVLGSSLSPHSGCSSTNSQSAIA